MSPSGAGAMPSLLKRSDGGTRRVGVEPEYSGLDIKTSAKLVQSEFGGEIDEISPYESEIRDTRFGDFQVELDFGLLKQIGRDASDDSDEEELEQLAERLLASAAEQIVPFEIVTPPLPMDKVSDLEALIDRLRTEGALGTRQSAFYAFGLHLNPEMPDVDHYHLVEVLLGTSVARNSRRATGRRRGGAEKKMPAGGRRKSATATTAESALGEVF